MAQRGWLALRGGYYEEALAAAQQAERPLHAAGLDEEAEALLDRTRGAEKAKQPAWAKTFDNPVFWGAFQLIGRAI